MWVRYTTLAALAAVCLTGCISNPGYRPCGPGYLNNLMVPQSFTGVDFRPSCQKHDNCYASGCDRKACDERFLNDMLGACQCSHAPCLCRLRAWQWYAQVRLFGGVGYNDGQRGRGGSPGNCRCQPQSGCQGCGNCQAGCCEHEQVP